jgi:cyclopropane fatty-acyl-phospholipid synthase-like methyltransferase
MVGPLGYWNALQNYQLNVLKSNGMEPRHRLLDIGCGPLQGGIAFIRYLEKGNYYGIDKNKSNLEAGKMQITKKRLNRKNPFLAVSQSFGLEELNGAMFDFMWASQVMYYFDDEIIRSLMRMITAKLNDKGKFLGDIIGPKHYEFKTKEHGWKLHTIDSLNEIANEFKLKIRDLGEIEQFGYPKRLALKTNLLMEITKES